jgi:hypothetical protein
MIDNGREEKTTAAPIVGTLPTTLEPEAAVEAQRLRSNELSEAVFFLIGAL